MFTGFVAVQLARDGRVDPASLAYPAGVVLIFVVLHLVLRYLLPAADPLLLPLTAGLTFTGLVMIYRLNAGLAFEQLIWITVGAVSFVLVVLLLRNYEMLADYKYTLGLAALVLLASTMFLGKEVNGARLWLQIGPLHFQPSELAKVLLVIFLAAFFAEKHEVLSISTHRVWGIPMPEIKYFGPLMLMWGVSILMMIYQKDLGSSLLFFGIFIAMLYAATGRKTYVLVGLALFFLGAFLCYLVFFHVEVRVTTWLHPFNPATIEGRSYQISQSLFALSSGGISGSGLGLGYPQFIPSVTTDFIFSAVGEELGLLGAAGLVIMYILYVARGIKVALLQRDDFGKLLAVGLTSIIALQSFLIMGGVTRLIPLTGITLPFVSYGGSSLLANFILLALLLVLSHRGATTNVDSIREAGRR
ncbi:MAG: FtsW/RodA/SpoVE family cell cycle protein [Actinobacteria bacterium]|nr:FtsW/RodA/SpoVE family cell cycle protein [Actinomycetota bacterium]MBU1943845.1 FtsW/RodA/SpoVE family cell cycle protein [Actinomycetota bacterium]MBU2687666.1 FtsW/RodA/SpoVE family cell cycle protein [Actinomycetota bacterium]